MIGERVRLSRESCRLTQQELAEAAGVSQGTISDLEAGRIVNPRIEHVEQIARATGFPTAFFLKGALPDLPDGHYRKLKRGTSKVAKQVRAQVRQVVELVAEAENHLNLPKVVIQPVQQITGMDDVERRAESTRYLLKVGSRDPIPNVTRAVERAGVVVVQLANQMEDHYGFSAWPDYSFGGRPIIALAQDSPGDRDRLTIGHELGHLILHTLRSEVEPDAAEKEAFRFAAAFLIPEEAAREALRPPITLRVLMGVKATFGASIGMGAGRAHDLGLISQDQFVSLRKQISSRGWRKQEPVEVTKETPLLISKVLNLMAGEGPTTVKAERLGMPLFSYRALAGS